VPRNPLSYYLGLKYPFRVRVDPQDGYVVDFPDLPGCMTDADEIADLPARIEEARSLWIETEYESGDDIPSPTLLDNDTYSGKFNLRLPHSLHEALAEASEDSGVSLNQYVATLLARGDAQARVEQRLDELIESLRTQGIPVSRGETRVADARAEYRATRRSRATAKPPRKQP
jgi:antitoxin HicB